MRAAIYQTYGSPEVVQVIEVPKPIPNASEVLIKIHATTVSSGDWRVRTLNVPSGFGILSRLIFGVTKPRKKILGTELSGVIESVGKEVKKFKVGDAVFASPGAGMGAHAEYICMAEASAIALKPANLSFEEAAAISFGASTAWVYLHEKAKVEPGQKVLINGASGCVGSFAVQIAKHLGAQVTGVCSTANVELVKSLGADHVIDYTREDFTKSGQDYDVIFDTVGKTSFSQCQGLLKEKGVYLPAVLGIQEMFEMIYTSFKSGQGNRNGKRVLGAAIFENAALMETLKKLVESGKIKPVISLRFPLSKIVEAHRIVDSGHKRGCVVVTLN